MVRVRQPGLLLGEWACLGALGAGKLHGFAVAKRLAVDGDIGRVWTLSRPLTYRALSTLSDMTLVRPAGEEAGTAGPNRTLLALTPKGRAALKAWLATPVGHPRDVRAELLLKIVIADSMGIDRSTLIQRQLAEFETQRATRLHEKAPGPDGLVDPVNVWRFEFADAAVRFLKSLQR
jgi:DNA-binding PadR family transcriptional regulator